MRFNIKLHSRDNQAFQHLRNTREAEHRNLNYEFDSQSIMLLNLVIYILHLLKDAVLLMQNNTIKE